MKRITRMLAAASLAVSLGLPGVGAVMAQQSGKPKPSSGMKADSGKLMKDYPLPRIALEQLTLDNGLRVVMAPDNAVPVISVAVYYDVGSRNERNKRSGFAHLFEHLMFQGSQNIGKSEHLNYVQNNGGVVNGSTNNDRTNYFEALPSSQLPLGLWLESDRMRSLNISQENLDNQREVVKEERRQRIDNAPYVPAFLLIDELVFRNPANAHSTIGSMEDLNDAKIEDVRDFFRIYYAPNNAVLVITGDFDTKEAAKLVKQYFATIPRQPAPPKPEVNETGEVAKREATFQDRFAPLPAFSFGWQFPVRRTPDFYALSVADDILTGGQSSRLYQKLVKGDESVLQLQGGIDERRGPSAYSLFVIPKPGKDAAAIRATILSEIARLATEGPTAEEMEKVRNNTYNDTIRRRQSSLGRAQQISEFALYDGDASLINTELYRYLEVTPEQVKAAAARYLNTENRVLLEILPARGGNNGGAGAARPGSK